MPVKSDCDDWLTTFDALEIADVAAESEAKVCSLSSLAGAQATSKQTVLMAVIDLNVLMCIAPYESKLELPLKGRLCGIDPKPLKQSMYSLQGLYMLKLTKSYYPAFSSE
jgi:hypothetical protein